MTSEELAGRIEEAARLIAGAKHVVALVGAGMSVESRWAERRTAASRLPTS